MVIQAETLFTAMKDGSLKLHYLRKWLEETCSELIQSHKRYYYQNQTTGEGQWEYPQPDVNRYDEAMDISTTPPPSEPTIQMSPPPSSSHKKSHSPPPPIISRDVEVEARPVIPDVPLPPEPTVPASKFANNGEPLPPGVDLPEIMSRKRQPIHCIRRWTLFYSEIAATETSKSDPSPPPVDETKQMETSTESTKKKKKSKVKLAPGLSMKKKGVSQLVEKWKNVQQHYND
ncbi:hypothetical protein NQ318_021384 [Aromia moschata]|uniref:WW domain-containing protein n=1 Tax=Aromia moschata TaxID=1265417 RepID=A0AAV8ZEY4_9CUCU|nr:hypothetical protein NQ318_021384 [Aromia moschata]